ncbi:hypothetical protein [Natronorubrum sp. DTA7]|uniref:hypothetical protein n=1 Tax=Natronorubrum sp. DTA7 TaxID=3447016 RepID=UPI003F84D851
MSAEKIASYIIILFGGVIIAATALRLFIAHVNIVLWLGVGLCVAIIGYYLRYYWT